MNPHRIFTREEIAELIRQPTLLADRTDDDAMVLQASIVAFGQNKTDGAAEMIRLPKAVLAE